MSAPVLISRKDAATLLGVSISTFDRHVRSHLKRQPRVGKGALFYDRADVLAFAGVVESPSTVRAPQTTRAPKPAPPVRNIGEEAREIVEAERRERQVRRALAR